MSGSSKNPWGGRFAAPVLPSADCYFRRAIEFRPDAAAFWCFRRAAERPEYRIEKRPGNRAGAWALIGEAGQVLRRGHQLASILAPIERRLLKLVAQ